MAKKTKTRGKGNQGSPSAPKKIFASPFKGLKKLLDEQSRSRPAAKPLPDASAKHQIAASSAGDDLNHAAPDDDEILRQALEGVRRLDSSGPSRMPLEPEVHRNVVSEDAEVLAQLSDLVGGVSHFDITETDEYVEGSRAGTDPRLLVRLRRGDFATQAHIDLHGMIQPDARVALAKFIEESVKKGHRAILVVHGRGLRSPGGWPVLKHATTQWLSHGPVSGYVLAFTTARASDGGAGATYVLLKRDRRRAVFDVLNGAKRRD